MVHAARQATPNIPVTLARTTERNGPRPRYSGEATNRNGTIRPGSASAIA